MSDFKLNKPSEVTDDNIDSIINDIYDAINRLSRRTAKDPEASPKLKESPTEGGGTRTIEDPEDSSIKFGVNYNGEWYFTGALTKEG